jgi:AbrB family looped-hinge helix DNA binding protein
MARSKLTSKGRTTIPMMVRERMGLRQGDAVDFVFLPDGTVNVRRVKQTILSLEGRLARPRRRRVPIKDMNVAIVDHAGRRHRSSRRRKP